MLARERVSIDLYRRIINMTVRYLKNLSFLCNLHIQIQVNNVHCFIALTNVKENRNCQIVIRQVYFRGRIKYSFQSLHFDDERAKEENI